MSSSHVISYVTLSHWQAQAERSGVVWFTNFEEGLTGTPQNYWEQHGEIKSLMFVILFTMGINQ